MTNHLIGHNNFKYRVHADWGNLNPQQYPVNDCHEMVMDKSGLLYLLTNETRNNILVYTKDGQLKNSWGTTYPGAHGLTLSNENGEEFLYITDTVRHQVIKTTLTGTELMVLDYPREIALYASADEYKPTETIIAPNGDIYVTDGYGHQFVIQYNSKGQYIRHWGGRGNSVDQFDCVHGIAIDNRSDDPTLLITSRNHSMLKRFTMIGEYLNSIHLPGSFICRPVVSGKQVYGAVFRSGHNQNMGSGYITIIDENNRVISTPGGTEPVYVNGILQEQKQEGDTFIHPHDVCVDADENLYIPQWNSGKTYPVMLERVEK
jgi:peptidylamidoglycolate lyase